MYSIGPYRFSETDAQRTVELGDQVFDLYALGRDAAVIEPLRPPAPTGDLGTDLANVWAAWTSAGPAMRAAGQLPNRVDGTVVQLSASGGGVPKMAVDEADVSWRGMTGDRQATRVHHGSAWQALCIWSAEVIDEFRAAGHPLAPGRAGENITVRGLPWVDVRPGVRIRAGEVLCEVSAYALPCFKNKGWFIDGNFRLMQHTRGPVSRVYATVLEPGRIRVGDAAILEPAPSDRRASHAVGDGHSASPDS